MTVVRRNEIVISGDKSIRNLIRVCNLAKDMMSLQDYKYRELETLIQEIIDAQDGDGSEGEMAPEQDKTAVYLSDEQIWILLRALGVYNRIPSVQENQANAVKELLAMFSEIEAARLLR